MSWTTSLENSGWSLDLGSLWQQEADIAAATIRATAPPLRRTPLAQVPPGPIGDAYAKLSLLAEYIASAYGELIKDTDYRDGNGTDHKAAAIQNLTSLIDRFICNYSYDEFAADPERVITTIINAPVFTWEAYTPPAQIKYDPFGLIAFPMQRASSGYRMPPAFVAYQLLIDRLQLGQMAATWLLPPDLEPFNGYGQRYIYDPGNGFVFLNIPDASVWYSNYDANRGKNPPFQWCVLWRDYWRQIESKRHEFNDKAERARMITWVVSFIALVGFVGAVQAVAANGLTMANGAKLLAAIDRLPGVEFGAASPYISAVSKVLTLDFFSASTSDSAQDAVISTATGAADAAKGANVDWLDFGLNDVNLSDYGIPFEIDTGGSFFSGLDSFNFSESFDSALDSITSGAAGFFGGTDWTKLLTTLSQTYVQYRLADKALESRGQTPPPTTRPTPGTVRQLADGTTLRTNADGSTTVTAPSGEVRTVTTSGQIVRGGASWVPGVPNVAVIGGVVVLGALLLMRKK